MRYVEGVQAKVDKQEVIMNGKKIFFIVRYLLSKQGFGKANILWRGNFNIFICAGYDIHGIACLFHHLRIVRKFYIRGLTISWIRIISASLLTWQSPLYTLSWRLLPPGIIFFIL